MVLEHDQDNVTKMGHALFLRPERRLRRAGASRGHGTCQHRDDGQSHGDSLPGTPGYVSAVRVFEQIASGMRTSVSGRTLLSSRVADFRPSEGADKRAVQPGTAAEKSI